MKQSETVSSGDDACSACAFEDLPRRIFLDSCTAQMLRDYGGHIVEGEAIDARDRIRRVTNGLSNVEALRNIFLLNERAQFEWIVSAGSLEEAAAKGDRGHMQWLWDIADHTEACLENSGFSDDDERRSRKLDEAKFGYLGTKDRRLLKDAVASGCEAFLTVERRLPQNAAHLRRELGILVLTPVSYWRLLEPWAALWL